MNVERTIEFMLKNQARMDARFNAKFDRADQRFVQAEKRLDRLERVVAQNNKIVVRLTRYGVSLRSDVRRTEKNLAKVSHSLSEMDGKLRALTDRRIRGNGQKG
jgi:uncharacterized coiled-coil protein SlyX